jgi:hypothetical protein
MVKLKLANIALTLATVLTGLLIVLIIVLGWLQFIDGSLYKPVLEMEGPMLQTSSCYYSPGDMVWVKLKAKKNRNIIGRVKWNLVDNRLFHYTAREVTLPIGNYNIWIEVERLPKHMPNRTEDEEWSFKGSVEYRINPIKTVSYPLETTVFKIVDELPEDVGNASDATN